MKIRFFLQVIVSAVISSICFGPPAIANAGVPTIAWVWPVAWMLLLLIVPIEGWIAKKTLEITFLEGLIISSIGNFISTLAGIPITWILLVILELGFQSLHFRVDNQTLFYAIHSFTDGAILLPLWYAPSWYLPAALCILNIPFCISSAMIEYWCAKKFRPANCSDKELKKWAWQANLLTYSLITLGIIILFFTGILSTPTINRTSN